MPELAPRAGGPDSSASASRRLPGARETGLPIASNAAVALIVDGDAVTRRFVELSLAADRRLNVETASTAAAAQEIMRSVPCDLVITEAQLPDLDGLELVRRIRRRHRGAETPILVLSADERVATKVEAFAAGADDYLVKPCPGPELLARVARRVLRGEERRVRDREQAPILAGELEALPLPDLIAVLEMGRRTATLEIHTARGDGTLFFDSGRLVHATYLTVFGARAFYHLFADSTGYFQLHEGCAALEHTVHDSGTALVMEAARLLDMARKGGRRLELEAEEAAAAVPAAPMPLFRQLPTRDLALGFTADITDGYQLAELAVLDHRELAAWSQRSTSGPRFRGVLFADATSGTAALTSMSTAPSERELVAALDRDPRCLVTVMTGRERRVVDIVLIDLAGPDMFVQALTRRPELVIVAPPGGDILQVGSSKRAQVGRMLAALEPQVIVCVGNASLRANISSVLPGNQQRTPIDHLAGDISRPGEIRQAIVQGLRAWLNTGGRAP